MTRKPTISIDDQEPAAVFLARPFVMPDSLLEAYAEMATDSDREAEAEQWLGALPVGTSLDQA